MNPSYEPVREDFGAIVHDVDLSKPLADDVFESIRTAHTHYGLLIFRGQELAPVHEIAFARRFNKVRIYIGNDDTKLPGHPEINVLSNIVEHGRGIGLPGEDRNRMAYRRHRL